MKYFIATAVWAAALWLIRRDVRQRPGLSPALWIPTFWAAILLSRPLSAWLGFGGAMDASEGSPLNRWFYFSLTLLSIGVLIRRQLDWSRTVTLNWPLVLLYGYLLISVSWAAEPFVAFKRWFKDLGNVFVALVILTESKPWEALRAVFIRCAYIWIPLSIVFLRWFPDLGRRYSLGGGLEVIGVTHQKNTLGCLILICSFAFIWEWVARPPGQQRVTLDRILPPIHLMLGGYLMYQCDSKTSIVCLIVGAVVLLAMKVNILKRYAAAAGIVFVAAAGLFFLADWLFGVKDALYSTLGRDATLTNRTSIWADLLALETDPVYGTGFLSLWTDPALVMKLPDWMPNTAHNGYLETYLDGGWIGVSLLILFLIVTAWRVQRALLIGAPYAPFQLAVFLAIVIGSYSESHFFRMGSLWFFFLSAILAVSVKKSAALAPRRAFAPKGECGYSVSA